MSRIRNKDTKPELLVRKFLFSKGLRYQLHKKNLPGRPDIVFGKHKIALFVHGCFWHGHEGCRYFVIPKTRTEWWLAKITRNREKDLENSVKLNKEGWKIINIFECQLRKDKQENTLKQLEREIRRGTK